MAASSYGITESGSDGVLYTVLTIFTVLAFLTLDLIPLPQALRDILVPAKSPDGSAQDFFLSARGSADAKTIAISFFAGGMGAWVVYGTTEMGATPALSWLGVLGYSGASAFPALIICTIGPSVKKLSGDKAFSTTDFAKKRYGRVAQLVVAGVSVFYMFIFLVSELTSISNIFALLNDVGIYDDSTLDYTTPIAISVCVFTLFYTTFGGLPASIMTDKFQGVVVGLLVIILTLAVTTKKENSVSPKEFKEVSKVTADGFYALVSLVIAIASAEVFNQGNWQRVWAAKDEQALTRGFAMGSLGVFLLMMFFGIMGMLAVAQDQEAYANYEKYAYLSFFDLLSAMPAGWNYIVLILITALCASSVDTLQNGIVSVFSHDILGMPCLKKPCLADMSLTKGATVGSGLTRLILVGINIPAVIMAAQRHDVLTLFLVADLVCATSVLPVFFGLMQEPKLGGFIKPPTEIGMVLGCVCGVSAVLINGAILGFDEAVDGITGETLGKGPFSYFWLTNGDICALCGTKTMVTFIVTPLAGGLGCLLFSALDIAIRGEEQARLPVLEAMGCKDPVQDDDEETGEAVADGAKEKGAKGDPGEDGESDLGGGAELVSLPPTGTSV